MAAPACAGTPPLEIEAQAEAELPRATQGIVAVRRENFPEVSTVCVVVRVGEVRRIGDVEPFRPELQLEPVRQLERAEEAQVEIDHAGPTHGVAAHVAKADLRHPRKSAGVEVRAGVADIARYVDRRLDLIGSL